MFVGSLCQDAAVEGEQRQLAVEEVICGKLV